MRTGRRGGASPEDMRLRVRAAAAEAPDRGSARRHAERRSNLPMELKRLSAAVETVGIEPTSAIARRKRLRAYPALWVSSSTRHAGRVVEDQPHWISLTRAEAGPL